MTDHLQRLAFLSLHSSPLAVPGTTKAGGMNVYIRELTQRLGASGRQVEIYTRRDAPDAPETVDLSPNVRVVNVPAGPQRPLSAMKALEWVPQFSASVQATAQRHDWTYDLIHSHYWLSGLAGITLADAWQRPHVSMFHTLGEIKNRARRSEREPLQRLEAERRVVQQADRVICATTHERDFLVEYYGAHADCVAVVPAGVDVEQFRPGDQAAARRALDLPDGPLALFIGRIEPIKGVDILLRAAVETEVAQPLTVLIVGGDAADPERRRLEALSRELGPGLPRPLPRRRPPGGPAGLLSGSRSLCGAVLLRKFWPGSRGGAGLRDSRRCHARGRPAIHRPRRAKWLSYLLALRGAVRGAHGDVAGQCGPAPALWRDGAGVGDAVRLANSDGRGCGRVRDTAEVARQRTGRRLPGRIALVQIAPARTADASDHGRAA